MHFWLVKPSTPAANTGPRRRERPCDASAARPLASACRANVWGGVSTAHPRPDGTRYGAQREQRGHGNASGGGGKRRGYSRHNRSNRCRGRDRGEWRRREAMKKRAYTQRHLCREKVRRGMSRVTPLPRRIYVSRRSTETGTHLGGGICDY